MNTNRDFIESARAHFMGKLMEEFSNYGFSVKNTDMAFDNYSFSFDKASITVEKDGKNYTLVFADNPQAFTAGFGSGLFYSVEDFTNAVSK